MQDVVLLLHHLHTHLGHFGRKQGRRAADTVLDIDGGDVRIGPLVEIDLDGHLAGSRGRAGNIRHPRHAVDVLLQRLDDRFHNGIGIRAGIVGRDTHHRRRDVGILFDRKG